MLAGMHPRYDGMHPMMGVPGNCGCGSAAPEIDNTGQQKTEWSTQGRVLFFTAAFALVGGVIFLKATDRL